MSVAWQRFLSGALFVLAAAIPAVSRAQEVPPAPTRPKPPISRVQWPAAGLDDVGGHLETAGTGQAQPARRRDSLKNGTMIGAGVGFAAGFLGWAAYNAKETASGPIWTEEAVGIYCGVGLLGAGIGAAIGAIVDAARTTAPSPAIGPGRVRVVPAVSAKRRALYVSFGF